MNIVDDLLLFNEIKRSEQWKQKAKKRQITWSMA